MESSFWNEYWKEFGCEPFDQSIPIRTKNTDIFHYQLNAGDLYEPSKSSTEKSIKILNIMLEHPDVSDKKVILSFLDNRAAVLWI